jgi:hypothetical protein
MMGYLKRARMKYLAGRKRSSRGTNTRAMTLFEEAKQNFSLVR